MPQKLNKAGKMQDYIPKGNGDASGEYGTSNGTNKNFTTSDKKSSKANVITENKSVVVENKGKKESLNKMYPNNPKSNVENGFRPDEWEEIYKFSKEINKKNDDLIDETYEIAEKYNLNNKDAIKKLKEKYSNNKANVIDDDLTKGVDKGKSATRKDKYGNPLVSDEAFKVGYEAGKKYLDEMTKYYDKDKLLMSNVFLGYLNSEINKGIEEAGLDENYDMTYQDANEIIGSLLNVNVDMEEYERGFTPSKVYKGGKYTGYKPKDLK